MYENIIGDLASSIYEIGQIKKVSNINISKLITKNSFISDDTILTIAVVDAILSNKSYEEKLKEYGIKCKELYKT